MTGLSRSRVLLVVMTSLRFGAPSGSSFWNAVSAKAADDVWTARYLLIRLCEKYETDVELHCKPVKGDWHGSGMHCNFSTRYLREVGGQAYFENLMKAFADSVTEHIAVYGPDNHLRLTGHHETQAIDKFSYGLSDRGASVRMPVNSIKNGYKGYLEDRRLVMPLRSGKSSPQPG